MLKHYQRLTVAVIFYGHAVFSGIVRDKEFILAELAKTQHGCAGAVMLSYFAIALHKYAAVRSIVIYGNFGAWLYS